MKAKRRPNALSEDAEAEKSAPANGTMKNGWKIKQLCDVCQIKPPKEEARRKLAEDDLVSFVPMEDLGIDQKYLLPVQTRTLAAVTGSYTYFADGDVLLAKITPCFENGKLGIASNLKNGIGFGSSEYIVFRPDSSVDSEWLYYYLSRETFRIEGAARMSGAVGHKRVAREFVEKYPVPVPPLPEQQRIVGILDEAFGGIATAKANAQKNLQNARALFKSYLQSVFTQPGEGWVEKKLEDVCHKITDGTHHSPQKQFSEPGPGRFLYITSKNIRNNYMDLSNVTYVEKAFHDEVYARCRPNLGDVLLTKDGASTGNVTLNTIDEPFSLLSSVCLIKTNHALLLPAFLCFFLQSSTGLSSIVGQMTGAAIKRIVLKDIKKATIPFPPVKAQQDIVMILNSLLTETARLEDIYQKKLAALDELKKSLLHKAFSGQL